MVAGAGRRSDDGSRLLRAHAARQVGRWLCQTPSVVSADATLKKPGIDSAMRVELAYPNGVRGQLHWDMNAEDRQMVWTVVGTAGTASVPAFAVPHLDNRILITRNGSTEEQFLGDRTSYSYQLAALATDAAKRRRLLDQHR